MSWVLLPPPNYDLSSFHRLSNSWFSYLWYNGIRLRIFRTNIPFSKRFSSQLGCQFLKFLIASLPQGQQFPQEPHLAVTLSPAPQPPLAIASAFKVPIVRHPRRGVNPGLVGGVKERWRSQWGRMRGMEGEETGIRMLNQ